ncbi:MAG: SPASM domain-containing protein, partial [Desulfosalsimonadaceae bacterium]|nr:SPASM domain-containing protein [Desulfosalsimonadaceae bacterium]
TDESAGRLSDSMDFFISETNCSTFQVEPAFGHGRAGRDRLALSNLDAFAANFLAAYDKALAAGRHLYYSGARPWAICNRFCSAIENALIVAPDGGISACYEVCDQTHPLAGCFFIGRMKGPEVSIDNGVRNELLDRLQHRRKACENCFCFWHCAGDCPSKTLTPQGDGHLEFRQRCDLNRLLTKELLVRNIEKSGNIWQWFPQNNLNCY